MLTCPLVTLTLCKHSSSISISIGIYSILYRPAHIPTSGYIWSLLIVHDIIWLQNNIPVATDINIGDLE